VFSSTAALDQVVEPGPRVSGRWIGYHVAAIIMILDQATKRIAQVLLAPGQFVPWFRHDVGWQLVYNDGGPFGVDAPSWFFLAVMVVVTIIVARTLTRSTPAVTAVAYGMLLAGALGNNALDRVFRSAAPGATGLFHGRVIDFIAVDLPLYGPFPRFNVADISITIGFVLLAVQLLREKSTETLGS
jgi:signal peptidase II